MAEPAKRNATYDDLRAVPEYLIAEIVHGRLLTRRMPPPLEGFVLTSLGAELYARYSYKARDPRFVVLNKPELHLGPHIIVPSMAAWPIEQFPTGLPPSWFDVPAPHWVCEIISPPAKGYELHAKLEIYAGAGIGHLWHVDARARTVDSYELGQNGWWNRSAKHIDGQAIAAPPFVTTPIPADDVWPYALLRLPPHARAEP